MMRFYRLNLVLIATLLLPIGAMAAITKKAPAPGAETVVKPKELSLVRVNVTGQPYDYIRPWQSSHARTLEETGGAGECGIADGPRRAYPGTAPRTADGPRPQRVRRL